MEEIVKYLKALVFLQVNQQVGGAAARPEVLLHKAGLKHKEIAEILNKNEAAIAKSISRARQAAEREVVDVV
jgi:hypothetical protein